MCSSSVLISTSALLCNHHHYPIRLSWLPQTKAAHPLNSHSLPQRFVSLRFFSASICWGVSGFQLFDLFVFRSSTDGFTWSLCFLMMHILDNPVSNSYMILFVFCLLSCFVSNWAVFIKITYFYFFCSFFFLFSFYKLWID